MTIEIRPATRDDVARLVKEPLPYRARLLSIAEDGEPIVVGGLLFRPDGVWASVCVTDAGRRRPLALHKAAVAMFRYARERGYLPVLALADPSVPRSAAWLERLGFRETEHAALDGRRVWMLE